MQRRGAKGIAVNGRFTVHRVTGVQRYAWEITRRLGDRVITIVPQRFGKGILGHAWEQARLPYLSRGSLLWSPCGSGPLSVSRQVVTIHDLAPLLHPEWFTLAYAGWYRWLIPRLCKRVCRIIAVSEFIKRQLVEVCGIPESRIVVVPNGVNHCEPRRLGSSDSKVPYFLYVGSLEPRKNLKRLLEAWKISGVYRDFRLYIVGAVGNRSVFRELHLPVDLPNVAFLGYVRDELLDEFYHNAWALVYPSLYEGFGLPVLEAMARGTPVITSRATACEEVAGEAALLVDPTNIESMAEGLKLMAYSTSLRSELAMRAVKRAKGFSWDMSASRTWSVLQTAVFECSW